MTVQVSISPVFNGYQAFDNNGLPLAGGKLWQYEAGSTSVQQTTYTDASAVVPNANPIVLDSSGRVPTEIYLVNGLAYNLVLTAADGTTVLTYVDNVIGVQASNTQTSPTIPVWTDAGVTPVFVSSNKFLLSGDQSVNFAISNRVKITNSSGPITYGTVTAVNYSAPNTQVTVQTDTSLPLSTTMTAVAWSILVANGITVDSGAVTYNPLNAYTTAGTVGNALNAAKGYIQGLSDSILQGYKVTTAYGTNIYTASALAAITSYSIGQVFVVQFGAGNGGTASTLNINNIGPLNIKQYNSDGTLASPVIYTGMVSQVAYNGTYFILLDKVADNVSTSGGGTTSGHGIYVFTSSGTFTVPSGVNYLKVTVVGGGGGNGQAGSSGGEGATTYAGGRGGDGGVAVTPVQTTAGTVYTVTIGAGGTSAFDLSASVGGTGGTSSFGTIAVASGGRGGESASSSGNGADGANGATITGSFGVGVGTYTIVGGTAGKGGAGIGPLGSLFGGGTGPNGYGTAGLCIVEY
jgi:hypothetical protein